MLSRTSAIYQLVVSYLNIDIWYVSTSVYTFQDVAEETRCNSYAHFYILQRWKEGM